MDFVELCQATLSLEISQTEVKLFVVMFILA